MENEDILCRVAECIRMGRAKKKLTQEVLAELVGISTKYMNSIENEKANPSITIVVKICKVLEIDLNKFLK